MSRIAVDASGAVVSADVVFAREQLKSAAREFVAADEFDRGDPVATEEALIEAALILAATILRNAPRK